MPYGLYISAEGAQVQARRLETISNNLANVDTVGFKRELALAQARHTEAILQGEDYPGSRSVNDVGGGVRIAATVSDFSPGPLESTGRKTDLAVQGQGFFVVRKGPQDYLTRAGNFELDPQGRLITAQGHAVLSSTGTPITLDPSLPWNITPDGGITQEGATTYLALVRPPSPADLTKAGENLFAPLAPAVPLKAEERRVAAGYLERSGVQPVSELLEMIEASRAFEANVQLIRHQDHMLGMMISRLLSQR
jgi:flagellar basal-body rod protein FlgF